MALDELEAAQLLQRLWPEWWDNRTRSKEWQDWALGRQPLPVVPDTATEEYQELQKKSVTPWLGLAVQSLAQALVVEGYRRTENPEDNRLWGVWQANRMDRGQVGIYEAAMTTGITYVAVLPSDMPRGSRVLERGMPEWRPYSSAKMTAFYDSPDDDWPTFAMSAEPLPKWRSRKEGDNWRITLFDSESIYWFDMLSSDDPRKDTAPHFVDARDHGIKIGGAGVVPVVRYVNRQTITGRAIGEIEPHIAAASRIDQDVLDRLIVQRFGAWRVRTATGLEKPETDEDKRASERKLRVEDILVSESKDTTFGSLPETQMDGHLRAAMTDIRMLATVMQLPPHFMTGDLVNVAADALAAVEASFNRKIDQRKESFGEAHEQAFSLSASILEMDPDDSAQVRWRDMEARALLQTANAYGILAEKLGIPVEVLWDKLDLLTDQDRTRSKELRANADLMGRFMAEEFPSDEDVA